MRVAADNREFEQFDEAVKRLLTVPRDVFKQRMAELKKKPGTRGPKRKIKPSISPGPDA